jgi:hypothetical protein
MKWIHTSERKPEEGVLTVQAHFLTGPLISDTRKEIPSLSVVHYYPIRPESLVGMMYGTEDDFWWMYAKDFPFPDQPKRLSEKTSKEDAIV